MDTNLVRLRKLAAEHGDSGSPDARDALIGAFLQELGYVLGRSVVDAMPDQELRQHYVKWTRAILAGAGTGERHRWLAEGVRLMLPDYEVPPAESAEQEHPANVTALWTQINTKSQPG